MLLLSPAGAGAVAAGQTSCASFAPSLAPRGLLPFRCQLQGCSDLSWTRHPAPCFEQGLAQTTPEVFPVSATVQSKVEIMS